MLYEFQLVGGSEIIERYYPASEAPELGTAIYEGEKRYIRIVSGSTQIDAGVAAKVHQYPYVSYSLPKRMAGCDCDSGGRPIIRSQKHEREICAQTGRIRD